MNTHNIRASLDRLEDAIINSEYYKEHKENISKDLFKRRKFENSLRVMGIQVKYLEDNIWELTKLGESKEARDDILKVIEYIKLLKHHSEDPKKMLLIIQKIRKLLPSPQPQQLSFKIPEKIPAEIKEEIAADIDEMKKCYDSGCYRSAVILCGRALETSLQRKYYETTGNDILEKSPGIGLGKLIAKMMEKKVALDPGLTQQIHLVNQVRIFSVHKKKSVFYPTQPQTQAMILYTLDTISKLF